MRATRRGAAAWHWCSAPVTTMSCFGRRHPPAAPYPDLDAHWMRGAIKHAWWHTSAKPLFSNLNSAATRQQPQLTHMHRPCRLRRKNRSFIITTVFLARAARTHCPCPEARSNHLESYCPSHAGSAGSRASSSARRSPVRPSAPAAAACSATGSGGGGRCWRATRCSSPARRSWESRPPPRSS